jgi:hypothetical protein
MNESTDGGRSGPIGDLESSLNRLESALSDAAEVVASLRSALPHIETLAEVVRAMESAMSLVQHPAGPSARESVMSLVQQHTGPSARESAMSLLQQHTGPSASRQVEQAPPPAAPPTDIYREDPPAPGPTTQPELVPPSAPQFLHLRVACKTGPLDLKAVDAAVGEQPGVVDVALLEYDGRHAVLQIWIANADPVAIGEALLEGLQRRLGGEESAEVEIEVPQAA